MIDLIFSDIRHVYEAGTIDCNVSDHFPTYLVKKKLRATHSIMEIHARLYKDVAWDAFREEIQKIDLDNVLLLGDPNTVWETLYTRVLIILDQFCPVRTIQIQIHKSDFIMPEIADQIHRRDRLSRKARKSGREEDWLAAKSMQNSVCKLVISARQECIIRQLDLAKGVSKKFWRTVNKKKFSD